MNEITRKLILMQGYSDLDIKNNKKINIVIRWTPLACSMLGLSGVLLKSPAYLLILGLLTTIGALTSISFYDYLYRYSFGLLFPAVKIPEHGPARKFGCAIGSLLFITSAAGFYFQNNYLAYIPSGIIISLAFIAAVTQWCFASTLYNFIFDKNEVCCTDETDSKK